jgi:flagellar biosynthesis protein FliR
MPFTLSSTVIQAFLLVFFRCLGLIAAMPVLGGKETPKRYKVIMAFVISLVIFPPLEPIIQIAPSMSIYAWLAKIAVEVFLGIFMGLVATSLIWATQFSGQMIGFQMGFAIASVIDPQSGQQLSLIARVQQLTALMLFLLLNGHHLLIESLMNSFTWVPSTGGLLTEDLMIAGIALSARVIHDGLRFGAPVLAAILLSELGLGLVARTVPQMNIFIVGIPLKIGLGLLMLAISMPSFAILFGELLQEGAQELALLLS